LDFTPLDNINTIKRTARDKLVDPSATYSSEQSAKA